MMKNLLLSFFILCCPLIAFNQTLGICGFSSISTPGDGGSFVLSSTITAGTKIYMTYANYYTSNSIVIGSDEVLEYTFAVTKNAGEVIAIYEKPSNTFNIDCSSGTDCGSVTIKVGGSWSISSTDPLIIFTDSDNDGDPDTGTHDILSFAAQSSYFKDIPTLVQHPNAVIISGLTSSAVEFKSSLRGGSVSKADLEDITNWEGVSSFSTTAFSSVSLPVELTYFQGQSSTKGSFLNWQTATEKNNEGFEVQRSANGEEWQNIGFVQGNGTTQEIQDYTYTDENPIKGVNYYRLKQIDFDGQFEYSDIVTVKLEITNSKLSIYPNPIRDELNIIDGEGQVTIYNTLGQVVRQLTIDNLDTSGQWTMNVSDLPKGQYVLSIQQENGQITTKRFMK